MLQRWLVEEYREAHPQHAEAVIRLFRAAQQRGLEDWEQLRTIIARGAKASR